MCVCQVKYKEEYERSKGNCQMEFGDTQAYRVSKDAQKMQSKVTLSLFFGGGRGGGGLYFCLSLSFSDCMYCMSASGALVC